MKFLSSLILIGSLLTANSLFAADTKDEVAAAAKKLGASASYSWTSTTDGGQSRRGPTEGKTEKDGYTTLAISFGENGSSQVVFKDGKGALKFDADWISLTDAKKDDGGGWNATRFIALRMQNFKSPAKDAEDLVGKTADLKLTNSVYEGVLTDDNAKDIIASASPGGDVTITNASGLVKFWVTDGVLTKYQIKLAGHMLLKNGERDVDRTTTIEIKDIDKTKLEVPEEAKKKIG